MEFGPYLMLASLEGAVTTAVLSLTAVGLSLVFGVMRVVNVAHGEFFMLGAVLAWWIASAIGGMGGNPALGFVIALVLAPLVVGSIAAVADLTILSRIDYDPERTIVATIGLLYIIQQVTLMTYGPDARPVEAPFKRPYRAALGRIRGRTAPDLLAVGVWHHDLQAGRNRGGGDCAAWGLVRDGAYAHRTGHARHTAGP